MTVVSFCDSKSHQCHDYGGKPLILLLEGDPLSGKTHLAHIAQQRRDGFYISGSVAQEFFLNNNMTAFSEKYFHFLSIENEYTFFIIDDIDMWPEKYQYWILHIINFISEKKGQCLLTAKSGFSPMFSQIVLRDLQSRLTQAKLTKLQQPDDGLIRILLEKILHDRQIKLKKNALVYLYKNLPVSIKKAETLIDRICQDSLSAGRSITVSFLTQWFHQNNQKIQRL